MACAVCGGHDERRVGTGVFDEDGCESFRTITSTERCYACGNATCEGCSISTPQGRIHGICPPTSPMDPFERAAFRADVQKTVSEHDYVREAKRAAQSHATNERLLRNIASSLARAGVPTLPLELDDAPSAYFRRRRRIGRGWLILYGPGGYDVSDNYRVLTTDGRWFDTTWNRSGDERGGPIRSLYVLFDEPTPRYELSQADWDYIVEFMRRHGIDPRA